MNTKNALLAPGLLVAVVACLTSLSPPLSAQPAPPGDLLAPGPGEADGARETPEAMRERTRERVRIMRAWRLTEALDLDDLTAVRLFEHLDAYDVRIHVLQDELAELGRRLREGLASDAVDEASLGALVEDVLATHLAIETLRAELVREAGAFLDARQQAALMLFLPDFERHIQQLMREARGPRGRGERIRGPGEGEGGDEARRAERRHRRSGRWEAGGVDEGSE